jgi:hypothetical protein
MPLPKEVTVVTLDVYGTLIDWETGRTTPSPRKPRRTATRCRAMS